MPLLQQINKHGRLHQNHGKGAAGSRRCWEYSLLQFAEEMDANHGSFDKSRKECAPGTKRPDEFLEQPGRLWASNCRLL